MGNKASMKPRRPGRWRVWGPLSAASVISPKPRCEILGCQRPGLENRPAPAGSPISKAQLCGLGGRRTRKGG